MKGDWDCGQVGHWRPLSSAYYSSSTQFGDTTCHKPRPRRRTAIWALPEYQVSILQKSAGRSGPLNPQIAGFAQTQAFLFSLLNPATVRQRITERYSIGQRTLVQRVTIEAQMPDRFVRKIMGEPADDSRASVPLIKDLPSRAPSESGTPTVGVHIDRAGASVEAGPGSATHLPTARGSKVIAFPILVPPKGELIDNIRVIAADGTELPVLPYRQYLQLVARTLRTLLDIAFQADVDDGAHRNAFDAEHAALQGIMRRADGDIDDPTGSQELQALVHAPKSATVGNQPVKNAAACELAAKLVRKLTSHYAIVAVVPCPPDGRFVITYERMVTPSLQLARRSDGSLNWIKARLRMLLGARPVDVTVGLENAPTTQSYHLIVDGREGAFVGWQEAPGLIPYFNAHAKRLRQERAERRDLEPPPPPYFRFRRRAGQTYAHFYARFFPEPKDDVPQGKVLPYIHLRFYEVPPGSVFRASVTAIAAGILIWIVGFITWRTGNPQTDAPAYLLAFPALAAGWLGYESQQGRLLEGSLAARQSLVLTVVLSIAASGLFLTYRTDPSAMRWTIPYDIAVFGIDSLAWAILMLASLLNAASISYMAIARAWEYAYLSRPTRGEGVF